MKKALFHNEAELLAAMLGDEQDRRQAMEHFFKNPRLLGWVMRMVRKQSGSEQDGKDVFEEAFIVFERQLRTGHFRGESSLETWFQGIARWQWLVFRRKNRPTLEVEHAELPSVEQTPEKIFISEERRVILQKFLVLIGERCQQLLGLFQLNYSMREIRELSGYASDQVAANEVHTCREKLKKLIHKYPESVEVLKNREAQ